MKNYSIPFVGDVTDLEAGLDISLPMSGTLIQFPSIGSAPSLSGPSSITEGASSQAAGENLDTVTAFNLKSGGFSIAQTIDSQAETTLDYTTETGVNDCVIGTPATGIPLTPTITAVGISAYTLQQEADNGTNQATNNITISPESGYDVIQAMIATSNTTPGLSILASTIITVEDDMQVYLPSSAGLSTYTWAADGTFTTDVDETNVITVYYFATSTGQWSCHSLTISQTQVIIPVFAGHYRNMRK